MARTYVVTGSASGIGKATTRLLEQQGARVVGVDQRDADVVVDLSTQAGRDAMVGEVQAAVGAGLDGVIACAGIGGTFGEPVSIVRVNYFGAVATLAGLRPLLANGDRPRAATIASAAAVMQPHDSTLVEACLAGDEEAAVACAGTEGPVAYASAKRALARWVRRQALTPEWAGARIPLNAVGPGVIETPMTERLIGTPERRKAFLEQLPHPLGGVGAPEHVASLLVWLTSPENGFVTAQLIFVDGGLEASLRGDEIP
jgi:NAD(P)-dependent dehydrogenase (short-subunit alcohol dehydrogenase family)